MKREFYYPYGKDEKDVLVSVFELLDIEIIDVDENRNGGGEFIVLAREEDVSSSRRILHEVQESRARR